MPSEERSCENCKHRASWTVDEDGTVWGADAECEGCIRFQCYPDKWEPKEKPTEGQRVCPKCGSENYHETDSISDSDRRRPVRDYLYCYDCGHKKKVR